MQMISSSDGVPLNGPIIAAHVGTENALKMLPWLNILTNSTIHCRAVPYSKCDRKLRLCAAQDQGTVLYHLSLAGNNSKVEQY